MNLVTKVALSVAIVGISATAAIVHSNDGVDRQDGSDPFASVAAVSVRPKDGSRLITAVAAEEDKGNLLIKLAQASRAPGPQNIQASQASSPPPPPPPPPFGPPHLPHEVVAWRDSPIAMGPLPPPGPMTRAACEDRINREAAHAAFIKSKLRLQPKQREAWQKTEDAVQPAIDKMHALCDRLPAEAGAQASLPDAIDTMQEQLSARVEFLKAVREPIRALFETLSPEQRMALKPPAPPHPL